MPHFEIHNAAMVIASMRLLQQKMAWPISLWSVNVSGGYKLRIIVLFKTLGLIYWVTQGSLFSHMGFSIRCLDTEGMEWLISKDFPTLTVLSSCQEYC